MEIIPEALFNPDINHCKRVQDWICVAANDVESKIYQLYEISYERYLYWVKRHVRNVPGWLDDYCFCV